MIERKNYFDVLAYLKYHKEILQNNPKTIKRKRGHLRHLLEWADDVLFPKARNIDQTFPNYLLTARNDGKDKSLSPASMRRGCLEARSFFEWAKINKLNRYRLVPQSWIETIRPSRSSGVQSELVEREYYTLEEIIKLVNFKPKRLIDRRDRAAIAFLFLSGMRISAFVTLPARCVDIDNRTISQFPNEGVQTKNSKAAITYLFPIPELIEIVEDWDKFIREEIGENAPWYPVLNRDGTKWGEVENPGSVDSRRLSCSRSLKRFCKKANISYKSPHKLRNGHGVFAVKQAQNIEQFKAYSQNMMHENMEITDRLYGKLAGDDIKQIISRSINDIENHVLIEDLLEVIAQHQKK